MGSESFVALEVGVMGCGTSKVPMELHHRHTLSEYISRFQTAFLF